MKNLLKISRNEDYTTEGLFVSPKSYKTIAIDLSRQANTINSSIPSSIIYFHKKTRRR